MGILDKDYKVEVDIQSGMVTSDSIVFATKDKNVSNIKIQFLKYGKPVDITGFSFIANIQKPDTFKTPQIISIVDPENGIGEIDLPIDLTLDAGGYVVEIEMAKEDEVSHSYTFSYNVRDVLNGELDDTIVNDGNYNILITLVQSVHDLESDIKSSESIRVLQENQRINDENIRKNDELVRKSNEIDRQESEVSRVNNHNNKLLEVDAKLISVDNSLNSAISSFVVKGDEKLNDVEVRFGRLTASQQQDAEVIDARTDQKGIVHACLNDRLKAIENSPYVYFVDVEG